MNTPTKLERFAKLQKDLRIKFKNPALLKNAFIHRSYLNEHKNFKGASNERLEFLGDSILSLFVSRFLFDRLSGSSEGELTQLRASLVRTETLAKLARELGLGLYLYLSRGEEDSHGRINNSTLANTFEALIGAIYLDQGAPTTQQFIGERILKRWQELSRSAVFDNKSKLQETLQRKFHRSPIYKLAKSWGPDHDRRFAVEVYLEDRLLGSGIGKNKQTAAQNAAGDALTRLAEGKPKRTRLKG
ncbi:ribonuclease III [Candidatus Curtissbacteria bacterium]|nr:ribonuclease III [Candidatus Curtissbacteria bacterium]